MPLAARTVHVPLGLPIDQAGRREHVEVGSANLSNVNVRLNERGAAEKRLGFSSIGKSRYTGIPLASGTRANGNVLVDLSGKVGIIDGDILDVYDEDKAVAVSLGRVPEASVTVRALPSAQAPQKNAEVVDFVHCNGYLATASTIYDPVTGNLEVRVGVETVDGVVVRTPESIGASANSIVQLGAYGTTLVALYCTAGSANVTLAYMSLSSFPSGWSTYGSVATDKTTTGYGASLLVSESLSNRVAFAYVNNSGGTSQLTVKTVTSAGVVETRNVNTSSTKPDLIGLEGSISDTLWAGWTESTAVKLIGLDADGLASTLATTATVVTLTTAPSGSFSNTTTGLHIVSSGTPGAGVVAVIDGDSDHTHFRQFVTTTGAVATSGSQVTIRSAVPKQRPWRVGTRYYGVFQPYSPNTYAIVADFSDLWTVNSQFLRPVANLSPDLALGAGGRTDIHAWAESSTVQRFALASRRSAAGNAVELVTLDFADWHRWRSAIHARGTAVAGGVVSYPDGLRVPEVSFLHPPQKPVLTASVGAGPLTGDYRYALTFEQIDGNGDWALSGVTVSDLITVTSKSINVLLYPLALSNRIASKKDDRVRLTLYRTTTGANAPYYYVGDVPNDTSTAQTYVDSATDATVSANRLLYGTGNLPGTNGAAQDRRAPPYASHVASYNGMLVVASGSDLWWSGQDVAGEATWFSPAFQVPIGQAITGLVTMDGTLIAFTDRAVYTLAGEAPSDNGAQGGLGTPRRLASDVGCTNANSIVATSAGVFFQSERGIELLSRGGAVQWVGEPVQDTVAEYPYITSAVLDDRQDLVRFTMAAPADDGGAPFVAGRVSSAISGVTLVFDLTLGAWVSIDEVRGSAAQQAGQSASMVTLGGERRYAWLAEDGTVYVERLNSDASAYLDGSSFVAQEMELPLWKLGLQQEQRAYEFEVLFERHSAAGITIEIGHNFEGFVTAETDKVWTESATSGKRQLSFRPKPRGSALGFRIRDTAPAVLGTGRGFSFIGLSSDIAPIQGSTRGTSRLPTADRR